MQNQSGSYGEPVINAMNEILAKLEDFLKQTWLEKLYGIRDQAQQTFAELKSEVERLWSQEIEPRNLAIQQKDAENQRLHSQEIEPRQRRIEQQEAEIQRLWDAEIKPRIQEIERLWSDEIEPRKNEIGELKKIVSDKDGEIARLWGQEIEPRKQEIERLGIEEIEPRKREIEHLQSANAELKRLDDMRLEGIKSGKNMTDVAVQQLQALVEKHEKDLQRRKAQHEGIKGRITNFDQMINTIQEQIESCQGDIEFSDDMAMLQKQKQDLETMAAKFREISNKAQIGVTRLQDRVQELAEDKKRWEDLRVLLESLVFPRDDLLTAPFTPESTFTPEWRH